MLETLVENKLEDLALTAIVFLKINVNSRNLNWHLNFESFSYSGVEFYSNQQKVIK